MHELKFHHTCDIYYVTVRCIRLKFSAAAVLQSKLLTVTIRTAIATPLCRFARPVV